jgi:hypothetical protein
MLLINIFSIICFYRVDEFFLRAATTARLLQRILHRWPKEGNLLPKNVNRNVAGLRKH